MINLLNDTNIEQIQNHFTPYENESQNKTVAVAFRKIVYEGNRFLESSLNNRLELSQQKNQKNIDDQALKQQPNLHPSHFQEYRKCLNIFEQLNYSEHLSKNPSEQEKSLDLDQQIEIKVEDNLDMIKKSQSTDATHNFDKWGLNLLDREEFEEIDLKGSHSKVIKNETKNIPKNYGKAIISFIEKNRHKVLQIISKLGIGYNELLNQFKSKKRTINTIADLRNLWVSSKFSRAMRILSNLFLRKYSLHYIFNSRITNYSSHIKYRHKLRQALIYPDNFKNIKDY